MNSCIDPHTTCAGFVDIRRYLSGTGRYPQSAQRSSTPQNLEQGIEIARDIAVGGLQQRNLATGMEHGCVIAAAKGVADVRQAEMGELLGESHGNLARPRDIAAALLGV